MRFRKTDINHDNTSCIYTQVLYQPTNAKSFQNSNKLYFKSNIYRKTKVLSNTLFGGNNIKF